MSDLEMFHVGENEKGEELYNVRYKKGGMSLPTPAMTKPEALAMVGETEPEALAMVGETEVEPSSVTENYQDMTKKELEAFMRMHDIELDRRKTKSDLLKQVDNFFKD